MPRHIGLTRGIFLVTITFIGTGIMAVPAMTATLAGHQAMIAWLILAVCSLPLGLVFAKLGQHYPSQGGVSEYVALALNSPKAKSIGQQLAAYLFLSVMVTGLPPALGIATANLAKAISLGHEWYPALTYAGLGGIAVIVLLGIRFSSLVQMGIVLIFVGLLAALWFRGASAALPMPTLERVEDLTAEPVLRAIGAAMWAFVGLEALSHLGRDFEKPHRDLPIAMLIGLLLATLFYVATLILVLNHQTYGDELTDTASLTLLYDKLYGSGGRQIVGTIGFLAGIAVIVVYFTSLSRLMQYLAQQHQLPALFAQTNRFNVPHWSVLLITLVSLGSLIIKYGFDFQFVNLITFTNAIFMVIYAMAMLSAIKLLDGIWRGLAVLGLVVCGGFIVMMISVL